MASKQVVDYAPKTYGVWVHATRRKIRKFFERIAADLHKDPLLPDTWYNIPEARIKEAKVVLRWYL